MLTRLWILMWILLRGPARRHAEADPMLLRISRAVPLCGGSFLAVLHQVPTLDDWLGMLNASGMLRLALWMVIIALISAMVLIVYDLLTKGRSLEQLLEEQLERRLESRLAPQKAQQLKQAPPACAAADPGRRLKTLGILFVASLLPGTIAFVLLYPDALNHLDVLGWLLVSFAAVMHWLVLPLWRSFRSRHAIRTQLSLVLDE